MRWTSRNQELSLPAKDDVIISNQENQSRVLDAGS